jgi:hypothetical protein
VEGDRIDPLRGLSGDEAREFTSAPWELVTGDTASSGRRGADQVVCVAADSVATLSWEAAALGLTAEQRALVPGVVRAQPAAISAGPEAPAD